MSDHHDETLAAERAAAPALAAKYDDACRSVADLHAQLMRKQEHLKAASRALDEARSRIPRAADRTDQKNARDLTPDADALVLPSWVAITHIEELPSGLRVHGWTTLTPDQTVNYRPAPGTPQSARWAREAWGEDD